MNQASGRGGAEKSAIGYSVNQTAPASGAKAIAMEASLETVLGSTIGVDSFLDGGCGRLRSLQSIGIGGACGYGRTARNGKLSREAQG
jgi:hypothetical protein